MSSWLDRSDPDTTFLVAGDRTWTYGEARQEVDRRVVGAPRRVAPSLTPQSVFDVLAGVFGGGLVIGDLEGDPAGAALVVPTSGTTGVAKGVRLTMSNLRAAVIASESHLGNGPEDSWLVAMPLNHVAGLSILFRQMWTGGSVHMLPGFDPDDVWDAIGRGVTVASVVPTMLHRMLEVDGSGVDGLRAVLVGGGPIPGGLLERAYDRGLPVLPTYGMTETFGQAATLRPGSPLEHKAHPLPGVHIRIGEDSRVAVRGEQVSPGYLGKPDRAGEWLVTNDLGELDSDGALRILGRTDTVIITGGRKVAPEKVEAELEHHPHVVEAVVAGVVDPEWGEKVVCGYTGDATADELALWLRARLPGFMVPKTWIPMVSLPRTAIGKPDRVRISLSADKAR